MPTSCKDNKPLCATHVLRRAKPRNHFARRMTTSCKDTYATLRDVGMRRAKSLVRPRIESRKVTLRDIELRHAKLYVIALTRRFALDEGSLSKILRDVF
ncbi:hypothetical protein PS2_005007 [Malus domestica]